MSKKNNFEHIPQEKFAFVQLDADIHDKKFETKARSFFQDAMLRFSKNKSSVVAAWILLFLVLFALISPLLSPYTMSDVDYIYKSHPSYVPAIAELKLGFMDGGMVHKNQNEKAQQQWVAIAKETGYDPVLKVVGEKVTYEKRRGQVYEVVTQDIRINRYFEKGIVRRQYSFDEFREIMAWQKETGIQVIYPWVEGCTADNANAWYQTDSKGMAVTDDAGNFVPAYSTRKEIQGIEYDSIRVEGDDGSYIYSQKVDGENVYCRVCYYNLYQYVNGVEPTYIFGTTVDGKDLFTAIGIGARFSLIFAVVVSAINLFIGAVIGAIQGYYGGYVDMVIDRLTDILSGVPFVVVATLFQRHLVVTGKVSEVTAFLFAFVLTGWIGMAALTRKQFYRFKSQEFVMAARTLGASDLRLIVKHVFPNAIGTLITSCALVIPGAISSETSMAYLGIVNLQKTAGATIGSLLSEGNSAFTEAPHVMLWPSLFLGLLMICFNLFGNGLRDAFNPSTRGAED